MPEWYQRVPGVENLSMDLSYRDNCVRACEGAVEVYKSGRLRCERGWRQDREARLLQRTWAGIRCAEAHTEGKASAAQQHQPARVLIMYYALIMAGGVGSRLWPLSRPSRPKQTLQLVGRRTLFQHAVDRIRPLFDVEQVCVVTRAE